MVGAVDEPREVHTKCRSVYTKFTVNNIIINFSSRAFGRENVREDISEDHRANVLINVCEWCSHIK